MAEKIVNRNHNENVLNNTVESFAKLPKDIEVITSDNKKILISKFVLSFHSPFICSLLNPQSSNCDTIILPDINSSTINHLFNIINHGVSTTSSNSKKELEDLTDSAKTLRINIRAIGLVSPEGLEEERRKKRNDKKIAIKPLKQLTGKDGKSYKIIGRPLSVIKVRPSTNMSKQPIFLDQPSSINLVEDSTLVEKEAEFENQQTISDESSSGNSLNPSIPTATVRTYAGPRKRIEKQPKIEIKPASISEQLRHYENPMENSEKTRQYENPMENSEQPRLCENPMEISEQPRNCENPMENSEQPRPYENLMKNSEKPRRYENPMENSFLLQNYLSESPLSESVLEQVKHFETPPEKVIKMEKPSSKSSKSNSKAATSIDQTSPHPIAMQEITSLKSKIANIKTEYFTQVLPTSDGASQIVPTAKSHLDEHSQNKEMIQGKESGQKSGKTNKELKDKKLKIRNHRKNTVSNVGKGNIVKVKNVDNFDFTCQICSESCSDHIALEKHYIVTPGNHFKEEFLKLCSKSKKECLICSKMFKRTWEAIQHLVTTHNKLNDLLIENKLNPILSSNNNITKKTLNNKLKNKVTSEEDVKNEGQIQKPFQKTKNRSTLTITPKSIVSLTKEKDLRHNDSIAESKTYDNIFEETFTGIDSDIEEKTRKKIILKKRTAVIDETKLNSPPLKKVKVDVNNRVAQNKFKDTESKQFESVDKELQELQVISKNMENVSQSQSKKIKIKPKSVNKRMPNKYKSEEEVQYLHKNIEKDEEKKDSQLSNLPDEDVFDDEFSKQFLKCLVCSQLFCDEHINSEKTSPFKLKKCPICKDSIECKEKTDFKNHKKACQSKENQSKEINEEKERFQCKFCSTHFKNEMLLKVHTQLCG